MQCIDIDTCHSASAISNAKGNREERMGCSASRDVGVPTNPLARLQYEEELREKLKRQKIKEEKRLQKLKNKNQKKNIMKRKSKKTKDLRRSQKLQRSSKDNSPQKSINIEEIYQQIDDELQTQLKNDLSTFLMNEISSILQLYGNFESEIHAISEESLTKERELNQNLEDHSVVLTSLIDAAASKWMKFKPLHGPQKRISQLLQSPQMYVIFENIDIARPNDANYDSISPLCKVDMETDFDKNTPWKEDYVEILEEIKWRGYIRLRLKENQNQTSAEGCGSSDYGSSSDNSSRAKTQPRASESTATKDYDYVYITNLNRHHPLHELKMPNNLEMGHVNAKVLPDSCLTSLSNFADDYFIAEVENEDISDYESIGDNIYSSQAVPNYDYRDAETLEAIRLYKIEQERRDKLLQQRYLNSKHFMGYFGELMYQKLSTLLGLSQEDLETATYRGASIHSGDLELIPAIYVAPNAHSWPDCAYKFRIRQRPICTDLFTGKQFQWPTRSMIKRIVSFGFHVIPIGYAPKRSRNPFRELEWRIVFPKAERYLEKNLSRTQVKVFLMAKAIVKTFLEPDEEENGFQFAMDHLRMHLFWECERNFTAWPEDFLGEVLLRFLNSFKACLRRKCLRDYFIEGRNLLENVPEYSLSMLHDILSDVTENPVMHFMVAFRNFEFHEEFFPKFNYRKLFIILAETNYDELRAFSNNPEKWPLEDEKDKQVERNEMKSLIASNRGPYGVVINQDHGEKTNEKLRIKNQLMRLDYEAQLRPDDTGRRLSVESINVEFVFRDAGPGVMANLRRSNVLEALLDHITVMIEKAFELRSGQLAKDLIRNGRRILKFYAYYATDDEIKEYLTTLSNIEATMDRLHNENAFKISTPILPKPQENSVTVENSLQEEVIKPETMEILADKLSDCDLYSDGAAVESQTYSKDDEYSSDDFDEDYFVSAAKLRQSINLAKNRIEMQEKIMKRNQQKSKPENQMTKIERSIDELSKYEYNAWDSVDPVDSKQFTLAIEPNKTITFLDETDEEPIEIIIEDGENQINDEAGKATEHKNTLNNDDDNNDEIGNIKGHSKLNDLINYTTTMRNKVIKTVTSTTEKLITKVTSEETRSEMRETIKRTKLQLRDAFI